VAVMYAGKIVEKAPTAKLFTEMRMPYTEALIKSIPQPGQPPHTRLRAIGGRPPDLVHPPAGCPFTPRCPYARDRCAHEAPPLAGDDTVGSDHEFACWYPVGVGVRT